MCKLDEARAQAANTSVESECKKRKQTECQCEQGCALACLKYKTRQPVMKVTSILNGTITECTSKADIKLACIAENDSHFWQSEHTPPMAKAFTDEVGFSVS
jgi:hypothetical protein